MKKASFTLILLFIILLMIAGTAFAEETSEYYAGDLSAEEATRYIKEYDFQLETSDKAIEHRDIVSIDVNSKEQIVLGFERDIRLNPFRLPQTHISVYDSDFNFLYGYSFLCYGSSFARWDGDSIALFNAEDEIIIILDDSGHVLAVKEYAKAPDDFDNPRERFKKIYAEYNGKIYRIQNGKNGKWTDPAASFFTTFAVKEGGETRVLFDGSSRHSIWPIIMPVIFIGVSAAIVLGIIFAAKMRRKKALNNAMDTKEVLESEV